MSPTEDDGSISLTGDLQNVLHVALNSVSGKEGYNAHQKYMFYCARLINWAAAGYVAVLRAAMPNSALLTVRPALEAMFHLLAVKNHPEVIVQIAADEMEEEQSWLKKLDTPEAEAAITAVKEHWDAFEKLYREQYPTHPFVTKGISVARLAEIAGVKSAYTSHYLLYCKVTHGALRAAVGGLNELFEKDRLIVAVCCTAAIDILAENGARVDGYCELQRRFRDLNAKQVEANSR
jgi:hypothetical protein